MVAITPAVHARHTLPPRGSVNNLVINILIDEALKFLAAWGIENQDDSAIILSRRECCAYQTPEV
jgi:hypothetical protein